MSKKKAKKEYLKRATLCKDFKELSKLNKEFEELLKQDARDRIEVGIDEPGKSPYADMFPEISGKKEKK